jgi:hypothetical protein
MRSEEELIDIAQTVAEEIIEQWFCEWGSWDCVAEDEALSDEEYEFIQDKLKVIVNVKAR